MTRRLIYTNNSLIYFVSFLLVIMSLLSCKSYEERALTKLDTNDKYLNAPYIENYSIVYKNELINVNELRFNNSNTALLAKKVMYDRFGMWDEKVEVVHQDRLSYMVWRNRRLIPTIQENFTVIAGSEERRGKMFGIFSVLDKNGNDVIKEGSLYRTELIKYFTRLIRNNETSKRDFYDKNSTVF